MFPRERDFLIDNLLVRIHVIIVMIRWTGLAPWEFKFLFPGGLKSTFRVLYDILRVEVAIISSTLLSHATTLTNTKAKKVIEINNVSM